MLRTFCYQPELDEAHYKTSLTGRSQPPAAARCRRALVAVGMICDAWRESLAASRHYEQLRSKGIPHDTALADAFGIGPSPSLGTRETAKSIYFAGRA